MATDETDKMYVMVIETSDYLHRLEANQFNLFTQKLHNSISNSLKKFNGITLDHNDNTYLISFDSVTNAILCGIKIQQKFKYSTPKFDSSIRRLKIGIATKENSSSEAIELATRICEVVDEQFVITSEIKKDYKKENRNTFINDENIRTLKPFEVDFLTNLMNFIDTIWQDESFSIDALTQPLGYSSSQIYRNSVSLFGKPPSVFLKHFRLNRGLNLIHKNKGNITSIARQTGFKSVSYFSKCFKDKFNILPSRYAQQHAV